MSTKRKTAKQPAPVAAEPGQPASIPPAPEMDPMAGDKTPAFVEWLRDFYPEEFARRYAGRKTHLSR